MVAWFERIDAAFERVVGVAVDAVCALAPPLRRDVDNLDCAFGWLLGGLVLDVWEQATIIRAGEWTALEAVMSVGWWVYVLALVGEVRCIRRRSTPEAPALPCALIGSVIWWRFLMIGVGVPNALLAPRSGVLLLVGMGAYAMTYHNGGGKTVWRWAARKARAFKLPSIRVAVPRPA